MPELASVDGSITALEEARIPVAEDGLLRGDGAFEIVRVYAGKPFALDEHLERLERSAAAIELPFERPRLEAEIGSLLEAVAGLDCQLRIVLTRGGRRLLLIEQPLDHLDAISVASVVYSPSHILTGVKSISYAANMQASRIARARGADEAVLVRPDGVVLEAPTAAIFWAAPDGKLRTPALDVGILDSITRARILAALDVEEGEFRVEELRDAAEAFVASTTREVQPISEVDDRPLGAVPGPVTLDAAELFSAALRSEL